MVWVHYSSCFCRQPDFRLAALAFSLATLCTKTWSVASSGAPELSKTKLLTHDGLRLSFHVDSSTHLTAGDYNFPPMVSVPCTLGSPPPPPPSSSSPFTLTQLIKPPSVDALYEWYTNKRREPDADPSWGALWPTAVSLSNYLLEEEHSNKNNLVKGKRVVELGAGLGLCGLVAAHLGAQSVLLTDREGHALHCAMSTAAVNNINNNNNNQNGNRQLQQQQQQQQVTRAAILDWADTDAIDAAAAMGNNNKKGADVILASDVLYDADTIELLANVCLRIGAPGGLVLLTDPLVSRYPNAREIFCNVMEKTHGVTNMEVIPLPLAMQYNNNNDDDNDNDNEDDETMTTIEGRDHCRRMQEPTVLLKCILPS